MRDKNSSTSESSLHRLLRSTYWYIDENIQQHVKDVLKKLLPLASEEWSDSVTHILCNKENGDEYKQDKYRVSGLFDLLISYFPFLVSFFLFRIM